MRKAIAILCVLTLPGAATLAVAQDGAPYPSSVAPPPEQQPAPQNGPLLTPQQLDNLVAPIALYPDPLLGQVLAAATYPLEIVEAQQWLNSNRGLRGQALVDAARQQNWDPSVAALVAFPDAMALLDRDIQWTTDLGNAFLAQQADVMSAIQRMRARAQQNGRLQSTPQETVAGDPGTIQIQPANPQYVYVPVYNPVYVWGPPVWGYYPPLWYPPVSYGCGYGVGVFLGGLFAGFLGFGGWGWGLSWLSHGLFLNGLFFSHYGFGGYHGYAGGYAGAYSGRSWWAHDPAHRMGVAYSNRTVAARYAGADGRTYAGRYSQHAYAANRGYAGNTHNNFSGGSSRSNAAPRNYSGNSYRAPQQNFNARSFNGNSYRAPQQNFNSTRNFGGNSYRASQQNNRTFGGNAGRSSSGANSFRAPQSNSRSFSAPHNSAPRSSGGGGHFSGGGSHASGGHSGGGHSSGGHSSGGSHRR